MDLNGPDGHYMDLELDNCEMVLYVGSIAPEKEMSYSFQLFSNRFLWRDVGVI